MKTLKMIYNGDVDGITEFSTPFSKKILKLMKITTFDEIIRAFGLEYGENVWSENAEELIEQGIHINEIISCCEDIMNYLTQRGICKKLAYKIMDFVRKGKPLTKEQREIMLINDVPNWYIESCGKIKYLLSRAYCAECASMAFKVAFYKAHFRTEFDEVIKNFI